MWNPKTKTYSPPELITFEGGEGAGKSSVMEAAAKWLKSLGLPFVATREPGDTEPGIEIRKLLLNPKVSLHPHTELLLFLADRAEHLARVIRPTLHDGGLVLCDRYIDSTIAYQGYGRQFEISALSQLHQLIGAVEPTLTFWLDVHPVVGLERAKKYRELDRMEADRTLQTAVRVGFQALAIANPNRIVQVNVDRPLDLVVNEVLLLLGNHLGVVACKNDLILP